MANANTPYKLTGRIAFKPTLFGGVKLQVGYCEEGLPELWKDADLADLCDLVLPFKVETTEACLKRMKEFNNNHD